MWKEERRGRAGRGGGGGNRRRVSDSSPDLTGSFISDFIQSHTGTLHMVKPSQARNTHTRMLTDSHALSLTHTHTEDTCSLSFARRKWLLLTFEHIRNRQIQAFGSAAGLCHCRLSQTVEMNKVYSFCVCSFESQELLSDKQLNVVEISALQIHFLSHLNCFNTLTKYWRMFL